MRSFFLTIAHLIIPFSIYNPNEYDLDGLQRNYELTISIDGKVRTVPLKKMRRNRHNQEENSQLLMPSSINLIDLDIPDYYSEAKVTLKLFCITFLSKEIVSEKVIRIRELFQLSSLRNNRNDIKDIKAQERDEKVFSQYRFGWNSVKILAPIRTEKNIRNSKLSPIALFSIFSTWNFLTSTPSTHPTESVPEINTEKSETASKTMNATSNPVPAVNDGNSVDGIFIDILHVKNVPRVEVFLRSRLVPILSCLSLQSKERFNIMNCNNKNNNDNNNSNSNNNNNNGSNNRLIGGDNNNNKDSSNNNDDDDGDNDGDNDEIIDMNNNYNIIDTGTYSSKEPYSNSTYNSPENIENTANNIIIADKQSELHFLIASSNSYAARTVMSVLGEKKYLKAALLLADSNMCNALDVALYKGKNDSKKLIKIFDFIELHRIVFM